MIEKKECEYCGSTNFIEFNNGCLVGSKCDNLYCMGSVKFYQYGGDSKKIREYFEKK